MTRNLCFALCFIQIGIFVHATDLYSVIAPGTITSNFKYNVAVSLHKADGPCTIEVGITGPSYNETKSVELQTMSTTSVEFDVPVLERGDYRLTAKGVSGINFQNSTDLNYASHSPMIYIQTDKATYKPGDLVQFRVLFLDENTLPAKIRESVTIMINDGEKNRIKQFKNIEINQGVYTGQFQLSEQPVLGMWSIEILIEDESEQTKTFEVAKYVLPKFEVIVDTAKDVAIPDGVIQITVRAKYTYGKAVKGKATISLKPLHYYYSGSNLEAQKTIKVDGKGHAEFYFSKGLDSPTEYSYIPPLEVTVVVEEDLTGNKLNATATINLHVHRYRIEQIETREKYQPGQLVTYKVAVKNIDGSPVQGGTAPVKFTLSKSPLQYYPYFGRESTQTSSTVQIFESTLNNNGIATFEFTAPRQRDGFFSVRCNFLETESVFPFRVEAEAENEDTGKLSLTILTKTPQLDKPLKFEVKSPQPLKYFVYTVSARGNIVKNKFVEVPDNRKIHIIELTPTFQMVPEATVYVHYMQNNELKFAEARVDFEKEFENSIDISTTAQAKPGEDVELKITTDRDSFVGLLGVDQSVLLLKSGNDLSRDDIFNNLKKYNSITPWMHGYGNYPGETSGVVTLTNAHYPYNTETHDIILHNLRPYYSPSIDAIIPTPLALEHFSTSTVESPPTSSDKKAVKIRRDFAETWLFDDLTTVDKNGFTLAKKIPDTITSWVVTGFSLNPRTGIALTHTPTKIQVFQPFFISTNLPYSVKRGEVISIPLIVFNYMEKTLDAEVTLDNSDREYEFTEATNEVEDSPLDEVKRTKHITIPSNSGKSVSFMIRPKQVGTTTLKITAVTPLAGDSIHQKLKVEPEGVTQYQNHAYLINLVNRNEQQQTINIDVPAEAVPDSEYIEFSVVGDLLGPTIKNIHELVRMPYGCGEQNMVNFVPNILVLKYLKTIDRDMPAITEKAKKFLEIGYQRELTYKHNDGSYSAFGKSDASGSTWLTAYVARSFHQAAEFTDVDPKVITEALDFLISKQTESGNFLENGKLFDSSHQTEIGLTAFVLLAFLENEKTNSKYEKEIAKAVQYLSENVDETEDQYALSIAATALQLARSAQAEKVLTRLQSLSSTDGDRKWLSQRPLSNDVEMTSYVLLALLEKESPERVLPIIKWLIAQRNSNGGFSSTQNTVVGLQALIKFAQRTGSGRGEIDINFSASDSSAEKGSIKVNADNSLVIQTHVLPKSTRQVNFTALGEGSCLVQLSYRFNLADKEQRPSFKVSTNVRDGTPPQQLMVDVCAEYGPLNEGEKKESNMVVMEIALPSGYTTDVESLGKIEEVDRVKRTETKNSDSTVIVYFDSLTAGDMKCIPIEAAMTHAVAKQKPAPVVVYDYYEPERKATDYYEVKSSLCDICEGEDCGAGCKKN